MRRIYAIGGFHRQLDLLERTIAAVGRDVEEHGAAALTVTVDDYIDRGPDSRGVLARLIDNPLPTPLVALKRRARNGLASFFTHKTGCGMAWRPMP